MEEVEPEVEVVQQSMPNYLIVKQRGMITKIWTFKNVGRNPWPASSQLVLINPEHVASGERVKLIGALKP